jgi:hypothetical protein
MAGSISCGSWAFCWRLLQEHSSWSADPRRLPLGWGGFNLLEPISCSWCLPALLCSFLFVGFVIGLALVHVLTKDFIVPQMAFEGISALEAWRRLWPMIQAETKGYAAYIAMKIVLTIVVGIAIGIVTLILGLILAIPVIGAVAAAVIAGKTAGLTWNLLTISAAAAAGCILFVIFFFLVSLISVPAIVFFPAYSIYFFAARYQPLSLALYSSAPQSAVPQGAPPPLTPPPYPAM